VTPAAASGPATRPVGQPWLRVAWKTRRAPASSAQRARSARTQIHYRDAESSESRKRKRSVRFRRMAVADTETVTGDVRDGWERWLSARRWTSASRPTACWRCRRRSDKRPPPRGRFRFKLKIRCCFFAACRCIFQPWRGRRSHDARQPSFGFESVRDWTRTKVPSSRACTVPNASPTPVPSHLPQARDECAVNVRYPVIHPHNSIACPSHTRRTPS